MIATLNNTPKINELNKLQKLKDNYEDQIEKIFELKLSGEISNKEYLEQLNTYKLNLQQIDND